MRILKNMSFFLSTIAILIVMIVPVLAASGATTLVTWGEDGGKTKNGDSYLASAPSVSANGQYVVFSSTATNIVANDTNGKKDVFVRDLTNNTNTRVSVATDGTQANNNSDSPSISADGRYVVFTSDASNLVNGDTNGFSDIFIRDLQAGTTTRVSVSVSGGQPNNYSTNPSISANGRFVSFRSGASNLVDGDTKGKDDIFVRDLYKNTNTRVSVASDGSEQNNGAWSSSLSANGRFVAFISSADNLVTGDTNFAQDVFLRDLQENVTTRVSVASDGTQAVGNFAGYNPFIAPAISYDGRYVAFYSPATNLVSGDNKEYAYNDVFVHDCLTGSTTLVSVAVGDDPASDSGSIGASISADGRFVAFQSYASNLVPGDTNGYSIYDIFVRDLLLNSTSRVSVSTDGVQADYGSSNPSISADGHNVTFASTARNLVNPVTLINDGQQHIFLHETDIIPTCYALTLQNTGAGSPPTAIPSNSIGCGSNQYTVGSFITLTADPDPDSTVGSWSGTNDDSSTATNNSVTMPASSLTVAVNYLSAPAAPELSAPADKATKRGTPKYSWLASAGAISYQFQYAKFVTPNKPIFTSGSLTSLFLTPPLQAPGVYSWHVRARDASGNWSDWSSARKITIKPLIPAAPVLVSPANALVTADTTPTFKWKSVPYGYKYRIQISKSSTFSPLIKDVTLPANILTYTTTALAKGKYYWRVKAANVNNEWGTNWSAVRYFTIK